MGKISCDSCGKPMRDDGVKDPATGHEYCKDCTEGGRLKDYETIKENLIQFYIEFYDYPREAAEKFVIGELKQMPAWSKRGKW